MPIGSGGIVEVFLPAGGTAGQAVVKIDAQDYNFTFGAGGGGGGVQSLSAGTTQATGLQVVFSNSPTVSFGANGNTITASAAGGGGGGAAISAGTQSTNGGTVVFSNSNGMAFGMSNNSVVTASYTVPSTAGLLSAVNVSAGTTSNNLSAFTLSNSNNVSFGLNGSTITASASQSVQTQASGAIAGSGFTSAGANIGLSGTHDSNGLSLSATVAAQTNQTAGVYASSQTFGQSSSSTYDARSLSLVGSGNVTVGWSNSSLMVSATQTVQTQASGAIAGSGVTTAGNNIGLSGTLNSAGLSFSATVPTQTNQTGAVYASSQTYGQSSSSTYDARSLSIVGSGGVSVGWSNSSLLISGQTTAAQTNQSAIKALGASNTGNTAGNTGVSTGIDWVIAGSNNVTISQSTVGGGPNTIWVSGPTVGGAQTGISGIVVSNTTYTSGTVSFSNANGISFGSSAGQAITASYTVPTQTNQTAGVYASSQTFGQSSSSTYDARSLSIVGSGGVSVGWSNSSLLISGQTTAAQTNQSAIKGLGASNTGNTAGNTGLSTGIDWVLAGSNNITISQSTVGGGPNTLWVSGPSVGGAQTGISGIVVSNTTYTSGTVSFSNANGISFGSSAGQAITASYTVPTQTNQTIGVYGSSQTTGSASSGTYDARSISIIGAGIISVGNHSTSAGGTTTGIIISASQSVQTQASGNIAGSGVTTAGNNIGLSGTLNSAGLSLSATVAAQTNQTGGIYVTAQSVGQSSSSTYDLRTLSMVGDGIVSIGWSNSTLRVSATQSNQAFSAAGGSSAFQTLGFSDNAAASFTNTNGSVGIASVRASLYATSNTTQSSTGTANLNSLIFAGAGGASVGVSNGSVVISVPTGGAGDGGVFAGVSNLGNTAGSTGTVSTGNFVLAGSGGISLSQSTGAAGSAATVTISAPNSSLLSGVNGISLSTNGSTISISNVQYTGSWWQPELYGNTMTTTFANNTVYFRPFELGNYIDVDKVIMYVSGSSSASTASFSGSIHTSAANVTQSSAGTGSWGHSGTVLMFSRVNTNDTHADYTKIISFDSRTYSFGAGYSASVTQSMNTSSGSVTVSTNAAVSWIQGINDTGGITTSSSGASGTTSFTSTSTNSQSFSSSFVLSFPYAHLSGFRPVWAPMAGSTMSPGEYWFGLQNSTNSGSTNMSLQRVAMMGSVHYLVFTATTNNYAEIGNSVAITSSNYRLGFGSHSGSNQTTTTMALTAISTNASNMSMWFALDGHSH